jgi:hypothetical protein
MIGGVWGVALWLEDGQVARREVAVGRKEGVGACVLYPLLEGPRTSR